MTDQSNEAGTFDPQIPESHPLRADIHIRRAGQAGNQIYVRCRYQSRLDELLAQLGGRRNEQLGARWLDASYAADVLQLLDEAREWADRADLLIGQGFWVRIPRAAADVRAMARSTLGGIYTREGWWAMPDEQSQHLAETAVRDWRLDQKANKASPDAAAATAQRLEFVLLGVMRRHQAEAAMPKSGTVLTSRSGQRLQIIAAQAEYEPREGSYDPANPDLSTSWRVYCIAIPEHDT